MGAFPGSIHAIPIHEGIPWQIGLAKNEGNVMAQWILNLTGRVIVCHSIRCLTPAEAALSNEVEQEKRTTFNAAIQVALGDSVSLPAAQPTSELTTDSMEDYWDLEPYEDEVKTLAIPEADFVDAFGKLILQQSFADTLIGDKVLLPHDDIHALATVMGRSVYLDGKVIRIHNENPLLNTMIYECEFPDGTTKAYAANTIALNIFMELDADGFSSAFMYHIVDHKRSGDAICMENKYFKTRSGTKCLRQTTVGWKLLVQWSDDSHQWIDLKILKESNPVQVTEYAKSRGIEGKPAFE